MQNENNLANLWNVLWIIFYYFIKTNKSQNTVALFSGSLMLGNITQNSYLAMYLSICQSSYMSTCLCVDTYLFRTEPRILNSPQKFCQSRRIWTLAAAIIAYILTNWPNRLLISLVLAAWQVINFTRTYCLWLIKLQMLLKQ